MNAEAIDRDVARMREDLTTLEEAAGLGAPFGWEVVRFWVVIAAGSAVILLATLLASVVWQLAALGLLAVVGAGLLLGMMAHMRRVLLERSEDPGRWREYRYIARMKLFGAPCILGFFAWQLWIGAPPVFVVSMVVYLGAMVSLAYGLSSRSRRFAVGLALPAMAWAAAVPVVPVTLLPAGTAACAIVFSLSAAGILAWQLRDAA